MPDPEVLEAADAAAGAVCRDHGVEVSPGPLGAAVVLALLGLGWTPPQASAGADLDELLELHSQTTQKTWTVMPHSQEDTNIVEEGRGFFGLIARVSTAPADYGRANARFIVAAHREIPHLVAELAAARSLSR